MKKKYISILTSVIYVTSIFSVTAMADENKVLNNLNDKMNYESTTSSGAIINENNVNVNKQEEITSVSQEYNLTDKIINPEFDNYLEGWESTGNTEIVGWSEWGNSNTKGCLNYGWYQGEGTYETDTHQTITGLENGKYILKAYAASGGGQEELYLYAQNGDSEKIEKADITDAHNFRLTFVEVEVTNNTLTIGLHAKGKQQEWANLDSVSLTKVKEDTNNYLNVIKNYDFKDDLKSWNRKGDKKSVSIDNANGISDNKSLKLSSDKAYEINLEQTINNLENGNYKLILYSKSSGGQDEIYAYAKDCGTSIAKTSIPVDDEFRKVVVDFSVTNNKATIGFYTKSSGGTYANFDDIKLLKVSEEYKMLKGGDLTELNYVEDSGVIFYDENGNARDPFHILSENGFNFARLRVYNETGRDNSHINDDGKEYYLPDGYQNKDDMLKLAKRAKDVNMDIELTLHYSDWWTNGLTHDIPSKWQSEIEGLNHDEAVNKLEELVYEFTKDVMISLKEQGTIPEYISLGNEMQGGILYPYGSVNDMETLARFLNAGSKAVREVSNTTKIILHLDEAGDNNRYYKLLDGCEQYNVDYDIIGPSYYPFWTRNCVEQIIPWCNDLYSRYNKKIMFMETGYKWNETLYNSDSKGQLSDNGNETHESTPQGQKEFMDELFNGMRTADDNCILGDLYWDPIMVNNENVGWAIEKGDAEDGSQDKVGDNVISNTTLFDFEGKALSALKSYKDNTEGTQYGMLSGLIVNNKGKIVAGAKVTVEVNGMKYERTSDKYGRFFLNYLPESKNVEITINADNFKECIKGVTVNKGEVSEVKAKLKTQK